MTRPHRLFALTRAVGTIAVVSLLAACSGQSGPSATSEASRYAARAPGNYTPPGPPSDPWGPYIKEASARFDVPDPWIRALMRVESGGKAYLNGKLITSSAGAMGLMQVMPGTYEELRSRHNLGDDPFDPHDNIMAGVAYMREMYDIYGAPGFLAAYNAGPNRLDDYLANNRPLPDETRRYVAMIGPSLSTAAPHTRSPAEAYAMNALPLNIPPGNRYGRATQFASAGGTGRVPARGQIQTAALAAPAPPRPQPQPEQQVAMALPPPAPSSAPAAAPVRLSTGFTLISPANAAENLRMPRAAAAPGQWAIQVGAYANQVQAHSALATARGQARAELAIAQPYVGMVHQARGTLWRARLTGLSHETAVQACEKLARGRNTCIVLSPDAQS